MYQIIKRDGKIVDFDISKIANAIKKAFISMFLQEMKNILIFVLLQKVKNELLMKNKMEYAKIAENILN